MSMENSASQILSPILLWTVASRIITVISDDYRNSKYCAQGFVPLSHGSGVL